MAAERLPPDGFELGPGWKIGRGKGMIYVNPKTGYCAFPHEAETMGAIVRKAAPVCCPRGCKGLNGQHEVFCPGNDETRAANAIVRKAEAPTRLPTEVVAAIHASAESPPEQPSGQVEALRMLERQIAAAGIQPDRTPVSGDGDLFFHFEGSAKAGARASIVIHEQGEVTVEFTSQIGAGSGSFRCREVAATDDGIGGALADVAAFIAAAPPEQPSEAPTFEQAIPGETAALGVLGMYAVSLDEQPSGNPGELPAEDMVDQLQRLINEAGLEAYFVPPPGSKTDCACTWPNGYPGMPKLSADCPNPQHARLARKEMAAEAPAAPVGEPPMTVSLDIGKTQDGGLVIDIEMSDGRDISFVVPEAGHLVYWSHGDGAKQLAAGAFGQPDLARALWTLEKFIRKDEALGEPPPKQPSRNPLRLPPEAHAAPVGSLAEEVLRILHAFNSGDGRRDDVRALAARIAALEAAFEKAANEPPTMFVCAECGPHVAADEDGCCASCGATATVEPYRNPGDADRIAALEAEVAEAKQGMIAVAQTAHAATAAAVQAERERCAAHLEWSVFLHAVFLHADGPDALVKLYKRIKNGDPPP